MRIDSKRVDSKILSWFELWGQGLLDDSDQTVRKQQLLAVFWIRFFAISTVGGVWLAGHWWLGLDLPWPALFGVVSTWIALNGAAWLRHRRASPVGRWEVAAHLAADLAVFSALLYFTGGVTNPFVSLYLPLLGLAAALLPLGQVFLLALVSVGAYSFLMRNYWPLVLSNPSDGIHFHLVGMWMNFIVGVVILVAFVARLSASVRQRDHLLRQAQGQLARESKLAALGNQAASIAHQLGTPAATLALVVGDWLRDPGLKSHVAEVQVLQTQIDLIQKTLAQLRAQVEANPGDSTANGWVECIPKHWLEGFVSQWRNRHPDCALVCTGHSGYTSPLALPVDVLELVLNTFLDNAVFSQLNARASNPRLSVFFDLTHNTLSMGVQDQGGGIAPEIMSKLGREPVATSEAGRGMGLFLACGMLERLQGHLSIENKAQGALVQLFLPLRARS